LQTAEQLWAQNQQIATAINRANTFSIITWVAMLMTGAALLILYLDGSLAEISFVSPLLALSYGAQWLSHNSSLATDDADYLAAVAKVKRAMLVWTVAVLVQVAAYLILNGLPGLATILDPPLLVASLSQRS